jgi:hypothetical protein
MIGSRITVGLAIPLVLALAACGSGGDGDERPAEKAVEGTFVGKVAGTKAFVAVVAAPVVGKQEKRDVSVYVSDGKRLSEWFPGSVSGGNTFTAASDDSDAKINGKLGGNAVTGTLELPGGKTVKYQAGPATGAAGLYDLEVSAKGKLSGASAAGIGVKGEAPFDGDTGTLRLADGSKRKFAITSNDEKLSSLRAGQVRLIVLGDGELTGAGVPKSSDADGQAFLIRSP